MVYITGDKHGQYYSLIKFCKEQNTSIEDIVIVLGDAGINYFLDERDYKIKDALSKVKATFFCIHGNHECRPHNLDTYLIKEYNGGIVYYEEKYPNILFPIDCEIYNLEGNNYIVIGGAYSVDKFYRLQNGMQWFDDEQPSDDTKEKFLKIVEKNKKNPMFVLSHTCPYKYIPREMFLSQIDQSTVDNSTEIFLDVVESEINYIRWFCGHYHCDKRIDKMTFLFNDIICL